MEGWSSEAFEGPITTDLFTAKPLQGYLMSSRFAVFHALTARNRIDLARMHFILRDDHKSVLLALTEIRSEANVGSPMFGGRRSGREELDLCPLLLYG